jgi:NADPH-dependent ferric siderophore reductase
MESPSRTDAPRTTRVAFTSFAATVARVEARGGSFLRVTLAGDELADFHAAGLDQRVKLIFPHAETGLASFPRDGQDWYAGWRRQPSDERCPIRTYTVRAFRAAERELDIDFVVHGDSGPATRWARRAQAGDELLVVGPDARTLGPRDDTAGDTIGGVEFCPGSASTILLAGDETAAPAICSILEELPRSASGQAFIEVASAADAVAVDAPTGMTVTWLARDERGSRPHGDALTVAVRAWTTEMVPAAHATADALDRDADDAVWEVPSECVRAGDLYAWIAGEAGCVTGIRRFLVQDAGIDRRDVAFMGYWRTGRSEN